MSKEHCLELVLCMFQIKFYFFSDLAELPLLLITELLSEVAIGAVYLINHNMSDDHSVFFYAHCITLHVQF